MSSPIGFVFPLFPLLPQLNQSKRSSKRVEPGPVVRIKRKKRINQQLPSEMHGWPRQIVGTIFVSPGLRSTLPATPR